VIKENYKFCMNEVGNCVEHDRFSGSTQSRSLKHSSTTQ